MLFAHFGHLWSPPTSPQLRRLATYGNCQERDFVRSRVDSTQEGTQPMLLATNHPIIQTDGQGQGKWGRMGQLGRDMMGLRWVWAGEILAFVNASDDLGF